LDFTRGIDFSVQIIGELIISSCLGGIISSESF